MEINKKELITTVKQMRCGSEYKSFYTFAKNQLKAGLKSPDASDDFFELIKNVRKNIGKRSTLKALGILGKDRENLKSWCEYISDCEYLKDRSDTELMYIMGYAERICAYNQKSEAAR